MTVIQNKNTIPNKNKRYSRSRKPRKPVKKEIFINESRNETRIAITENDQLAEILLERPENTRMVGDIYKGTVARVNPGMRAAFIDIGLDHDGFLHFSDINESVHDFMDLFESEYDEESSPKSRGTTIRGEWMPKPGQEIIVQITKEPIHDKGPRVTTHISLPGRFIVLVPNDKQIGISRKINSFKEKRRLQKIARNLKPDDFGLILRTVAQGKSAELIENDFNLLMSDWKIIEKEIKKSSPPTLVYKDMEMAFSVIRDLLTEDVGKIVIDSKKLYRKLGSYLKNLSPHLLEKLEFYNEQIPIFDAYNIEPEIEKTQHRKVWLKSGGYLIIDHTEALVTVDINSGRFQGKKEHELNSLKINLEAVPEVARQLRLRDIGGIIVVDFIDMDNEKNRKSVYLAMRKEMAGDRARSKVFELSELGLLEMTRQRIGPGLLYRVSDVCPICDGLGRVISKDTLMNKIERWIKRMKVENTERRLILNLHPDVAYHFLENSKESIRRLMWKYWVKIDIKKDSELSMNDFKIISKKTGEDITDQFMS